MALRFHGLGRQVAGQPVLDGVELAVRPGEFLAIAGPSGCGKTSLLRLAAGLDRPDAGAVLDSQGEITGPSHRRGVIFQDATLFPWMSVLENVTFGPLSRGIDGARAQKDAREWLSFLGLARFEGAYPGQLSGGMQRRVAIARAMVNEPEILLCDEPFAGLDWITAQKVMDELLRVWERTGMTVVFVTHALEEAVYAAQRVVLLSRRPARVVQEFAVDLPERRWSVPDLRFHPDCAQQVEKVRAAFQKEAS